MASNPSDWATEQVTMLPPNGSRIVRPGCPIASMHFFGKSDGKGAGCHVFGIGPKKSQTVDIPIVLSGNAGLPFVIQ